MFNKADRNKDGKLTSDEWKQRQSGRRRQGKNLVCVIQAGSGGVLPENGPRFCRLRSMVHLLHYAIYIHREKGRVSQILEPNI